jgi:hypothetical protein
MQSVWLGDRRVIYRETPNNGEAGFAPVVQELTAEGFKDLVKGSVANVALDLKEGRFITPDCTTFKFGDFVVPQYDIRFAMLGVPVRDKGGRIWRGLVRVAPEPKNLGPRPFALSRELMWQIGAPKVCELDMTDGFKCVHPEAAYPATGGGLTSYDAGTRTGWQIYDRPRGSRSYRCLEVDKEGYARVVMELSESDGLKGCPTLRAPDGSWWGMEEWTPQNPVFRVSPEGKVSRYTIEGLKEALNRPGMSLLVSPKGTVIAAGEGFRASSTRLLAMSKLDSFPYWSFNAKQDKFEYYPGAMDEFSCNIGKLELAAIPPDIWWINSLIMMQKVNGGWEQFVPPFIVPRSTGQVSVLPYIRGDRMLMSFAVFGIYEYDGKNDRWVRLVDDRMGSCWQFASLDAHGRRILIGDNCALVYDGDPFESDAWKAKKAETPEEELYQSLLKKLDSDQFEERQKASEELKKLMPGCLPTLERTAASKKLSAEAMERVADIIGTVNPTARNDVTMPALLELECPPPPPVTTRPAEK